LVLVVLLAHRGPWALEPWPSLGGASAAASACCAETGPTVVGAAGARAQALAPRLPLSPSRGRVVCRRHGALGVAGLVARGRRGRRGGGERRR